MINYSYTINSMYTVNLPTEPYYVVQVNYTYTGTDGQYSSSISNSLFYNITQSSVFIPYEDLTKEIVVSWIESSLGADGVANNQNCIADQIYLQQNPPVIPQSQPLPFEN